MSPQDYSSAAASIFAFRHVFAPAGLLAGLLFSAQAFAQQQEPPTVTAAKPVVREIVEDDEFVGRFEAVDQVAIRSRVNGYLEEIHFTDGALVKQGDLLFTIDQRPYQAAYDAAKSRVDVATSLLDFSKLQLQRAEELANSGNLPTSTLDDRRREYLAAEAGFQGAAAALKTASLDLEFTEIKAPLAGRIDRRLVSVGNLVQSDTTLLTTIVATDPIDFYFDVDERLYLAYANDARQRGGSVQEGSRRPRCFRPHRRPPGRYLQGQARLRREPHRRRDWHDARACSLRQFRWHPAARHVRPHQRARLASLQGHHGARRGDRRRPGPPHRLCRRRARAMSAPSPSAPARASTATASSAKGLTGDETIVINGLMRVRPGVKVKAEVVTLPPEAEVAGAPQ